MTRAAATPSSSRDERVSAGIDGRRLADIDHPAPAHTFSSAIPTIVAANRDRRMWTLVLDDDPTGTQTVRTAPVVLPHAPEAALAWAAQQDGGTAFVLTNTRAVDEESARRTIYDAVTRAGRLAAELGLRLRVVTRSDSTLRGHFRTELTAARDAMADAGTPVDGIVFAPCFLEAGRFTAQDTQWVRQGEHLVPAAHTEFARDLTFGYHETDLRQWVRSRWPEPGADVGSLSLRTLRGRTGLADATTVLAQLRRCDVVVANAVRSSDLEVLMLAVIAAEQAGRRILIRSGPSMVRLCAGQTPPSPLTDAEVSALRHGRAGRGLVVAGSHTALTNVQIAAAQALHRPALVELDAAAALHDDDRAVHAEVDRCADAAARGLADRDVVLRTTRPVIHTGRSTPLLVSRAVAAALSAVVTAVVRRRPPGYLVAKGGITSSDIASEALGATKAVITGQLFAGQVPVWSLQDGALPGLPYVVFPGNVGDENALATIMARLRAGSAPAAVPRK